MLIDTHAHLYWDSFQNDLEEVIDRCLQSNVKTLINVGTDLDTSQKALEQVTNPDSPLAKLTAYSSIGLHPHEAYKYEDYQKIAQDLQILEQLYSSHPEKVIAIGECGLDFFFHGNSDYNPTHLSEDKLKTIQKKLFKSQVELSKKLGLPLIIHCRDAWSDIFEGLKGSKGLFHTFTGNNQDAKKALDLGFYLSISCIITYPKNEALREVVKETPLDKLLTETDCPFLPPQSRRGQRNEPAYIIEIIQTIAQIKEMSENEVSTKINQNFHSLFKVYA